MPRPSFLKRWYSMPPQAMNPHHMGPKPPTNLSWAFTKSIDESWNSAQGKRKRSGASKPAKANIATRPCFNSASRYHARCSGQRVEKPTGSHSYLPPKPPYSLPTKPLANGASSSVFFKPTGPHSLIPPDCTLRATFVPRTVATTQAAAPRPITALLHMSAPLDGGLAPRSAPWLITPPGELIVPGTNVLEAPYTAAVAAKPPINDFTILFTQKT
mmetsp:Transcript_17388/g.39188  ORF Transcript_17388/g.39188 Transcript_17388/m.39188 type:complete len:215 (-) Transcript_17388:52-696(-)